MSRKAMDLMMLIIIIPAGSYRIGFSITTELTLSEKQKK